MPVLNQGGNYLKADNVKDGDIVTFKDQGTWVESKYSYPDGNLKQDFVMKVEHQGVEYSLRVGKFSRDELVPRYGNNTDDWVGKKAKITIETYRSLNTKGIILSPIESASKEATEDVKPAKEVWDE